MSYSSGSRELLVAWKKIQQILRQQLEEISDFTRSSCCMQKIYLTGTSTAGERAELNEQHQNNMCGSDVPDKFSRNKAVKSLQLFVGFVADTEPRLQILLKNGCMTSNPTSLRTVLSVSDAWASYQTGLGARPLPTQNNFCRFQMWCQTHFFSYFQTLTSGSLKMPTRS